MPAGITAPEKLKPKIVLLPEETENSRQQKAKGGQVYNVPKVPVEPDERIDKMTGLPYDQQAGEAFVDEEDRNNLENLFNQFFRI